MAHSLLECWCSTLAEFLGDAGNQLAGFEHFRAPCGGQLIDGAPQDVSDLGAGQDVLLDQSVQKRR
jgi:hypothetical protein